MGGAEEVRYEPTWSPRGSSGRVAAILLAIAASSFE